MKAERYVAMAREDDEVLVTVEGVVRECATSDGFRPCFFVMHEGTERVIPFYDSMQVKVVRRADETVEESLKRLGAEAHKEQGTEQGRA